MQTPFMTPAETRRASLKHVADAAAQINESLAAGARLFTVNLGIVDLVADALREAGWIIEIKERTETQGTFLVADPESRREAK